MKTNSATGRSPRLPLLLACVGILALVGVDVWLGYYCCRHRAQTLAAPQTVAAAAGGTHTISEFWLAAR